MRRRPLRAAVSILGGLGVFVLGLAQLAQGYGDLSYVPGLVVIALFGAGMVYGGWALIDGLYAEGVLRGEPRPKGTRTRRP